MNPKETEKYLNPIDMLKYLDETCVKNPDGSLSLGTYEVQMIKNSIERYAPKYGGWAYPAVVDIGLSLGYDIPDEVANEILRLIDEREGDVMCDSIYQAIEDDLYDLGLDKYYTGIEGLDYD